MAKPPVHEAADMSYTAMHDRLLRLQAPLKLVMDDAVKLFDDFFDEAPHPSEVDKDFPVYSVATMNICPDTNLPMGREFTVVLGSRKWLRVFRNTASCPSAYPNERIWYWSPLPDEDLLRQVDITRRDDARVHDKSVPYDIETGKYNDRGTCQGFVGYGYVDQEQIIDEVEGKIVDARAVAESVLG